MHRMIGLALVLGLGLLISPSVDAAILASDDFSATGSGFGWEAGSDWDGIVAGGVATWSNPPQGNRNFASPIDPTAGKIYIAFDYAQTENTAAGSQWGGAAFFEGVDAGGSETAFIGNPGPIGNYGIDMKNDPDADQVDSGIPIDTQTRRLIAEYDVSGANQTTRFWVDSNNIFNPTASSPITDSVIDGTWLSLRLAGDGMTTNTTDNLVIGTSPDDVGLVVPEPASLLLLLGSLAMLGVCRRR